MTNERTNKSSINLTNFLKLKHTFTRWRKLQVLYEFQKIVKMTKN